MIPKKICAFIFTFLCLNICLSKETYASYSANYKTAEKPIKGVVKNKIGETLIGVSVKIKNSSKGTQTDVNGSFALMANPNDVLEFSYIGYITQQVTVSNSNFYTITLAENSNALNEVVVTALGIEKGKAGLTYATQTVKSDELNRVKDPNLMNAIAGKTAGVVITKGNGGPGASAKVLIRGNKSITGNNQPLYVIDGIPMNVSANGAQGSSLSSFDGARDGGDNISNLNPEDIESISVLKGASAAALYGGNAANGVILITTKKGKKGVTNVDFSSNITFENPISLPEKQTSYGQGYGGVANTNVNDDWGPLITNGSDAYLKDFFNTGKTYINNIAVSTGTDKGQIYLSYANTNATGIAPNNLYDRHNFNVRGTTQLFNNKLSLDGSINYVNQTSKNRPWAGNFFNPIFSLYLFPNGDDFNEYAGDNFEVYNATRNLKLQNWPYLKNEASSNQNPYWIQNRNLHTEKRDRNIYSLSTNYKINDWLDIKARGTLDKILDDYEIDNYAGTDPLMVGINGGYRKNITQTDQFYSDLLLTGTKTFNNFNVNATIGASNTSNTYYDNDIGTSGANNTLLFANVFSTQNLVAPFNAEESLRKTLSQAVFATATLGFKETLFLDLTGRNEWSSTVDDSFFYPSAGLSYVFTNTFKNTGALSFGKVRGSYAEVGNALKFGVNNPFPARNINNGAATPVGSKALTKLLPERTRSYEFGSDLAFFSNAINVGFTYYNATTYDQVFSILAPPGSGVVNYIINGGTIRNIGYEGTISVNKKFNNLKWISSVNFSHNDNKILELSNLLNSEYFVLTQTNQTRMVQLLLARPGISNLGGKEYGSYGDIFGKTYVRDADGNLTYDTNGLPIISANPDQYVGNANPDFLLGFNNQFSYKKFSFSFLIDSRFGGDIVSQSQQWLDFKGQSVRSAEARDAGGVVLNGKTIPAEAYYNFISGKGDAAAAVEEYIYNASNVRLREIALGYTLPSFTKGIKNLNLSLVARNVAFFYKDAPFDPEVSISTNNSLQGMEGFALPATRSIGLSLKANF